MIVGERTNVLGSRKFKRLIAEGKFEEATEIGRVQVRRGAHVIDVCLQDPDRDEMADVTRFLEIDVKKVNVPLMIDSTDHRVIEESLKRTPGKSIINSINLEDGEERFEKVVPLARHFGAALVVGCIDDDKQQGRPSPVSASCRSRSARSSCSPKNTASSPKTSSSTRSSSRSAPATRTTSAPASKRSKACG